MTHAEQPTIKHGNRLFLSGITAQDLSADIGAQTREALEMLDERLAEAGIDRASVLTVHIWLQDMALFQAMTAAWNDWIGDGDAPSRSCVSGGPPNGQALVQVVATAVCPVQGNENAPIERYGLVKGPGSPTMCLAIANQSWFTVCTLASDCSQDIAGQTRQILNVFDRFMAEAGTDKSRLLTMEVWLKNQADRDATGRVLDTWLDPAHPPATSFIRADMARPEMLIEIRITASR